MFSMLRKVFSLTRANGPFRGLASSSDKGSKTKDPSPKDVLGSDLLDAVNAVAEDLHGGNTDAKKTTKNTLISKLVSHEKKSFAEATAAQSSSMLDDKAVLNLVQGIGADGKPSQPRSAKVNQERRGLVVLRKEIFYQAVQSGYNTDEARAISEKAVDEAQQRLSKQRKAAYESLTASEQVSEDKAKQRHEKEEKLFEFAYQMVEKMLYQEDVSGGRGSSRKVYTPDPAAPSLFKSGKKLGIWESMDGVPDRSLGFWAEWDMRAARLNNQSMGPENSFQEQMEWTEKGKQWPYPIDNEYSIGDEENVSFLEHVFLERHLPNLGLPKSGPIAHFMQLVCVGLSKNPYMSVSKKLEHIHWFGKYFNAEKQKLVHRLHDDEQIAAQNA